MFRSNGQGEKKNLLQKSIGRQPAAAVNSQQLTQRPVAMTHCDKGCLPDLLNQLIFGQRGLEGFHLVALGRENVPPGLVDIF